MKSWDGEEEWWVQRVMEPIFKMPGHLITKGSETITMISKSPGKSKYKLSSGSETLDWSLFIMTCECLAVISTLVIVPEIFWTVRLLCSCAPRECLTVLSTRLIPACNTSHIGQKEDDYKNNSVEDICSIKLH